jgi:transposase-like protein
MKKTSLIVQRIFSEELRKEVVTRIESGHLSVIQASREYGACKQSIYKWLNKYSRNLKTGTRIVMEKDSTDNRISDLQRQIKELESALGRKTLESDLYRIIVELASEEYKTDFKKNYGNPLLPENKKKQ